MSTKAKSTYAVTGWDEKPYNEGPGPAKLTRAKVGNTFTGDIDGAGHAEYLMTYPSEIYASFVGLQHVDGSIGGRKGTFVLQTTGEFVDGVARAKWFVVSGSGTGGLTGLAGKGGYESTSDGSANVTLSYDFT